MYPVIYQNRFFTIYSLGLFLILGVIIFLSIFYYLTKRKNLDISFIVNNFFWIIIFIFFTSKLFSITRFFLKTESANFSIENITTILSEKSFVLLGVLYGFLISIFFITKRTNRNFILWMDILMSPFLFFLTLGELGNFLSGQNIGTATNLPWGVVVNILNSSTFDLKTHPISLYNSILFFSLGLYSLYQSNYRHPRGYIFFRNIFLISLFLFALNFKISERVIIFSLFNISFSFSQLVIFPLLVYGTIGELHNRKNKI